MICLVAALLAASPAAPPKVLVLDTQPGSAGVSPKLADKATELLRAQLAKSGAAVVSGAELERLKRGASGSGGPELSNARTGLELGKEAYLNLEFQKARSRLAPAATAFEAALPQGADFAELAEAWLYLGASTLGLGKESEARGIFLSLLKLRPDHQLDARVWSPEVQECFARAREGLSKVPTAPVQLSTAPPLAQVFLDGQLRGETPLTLEKVPVGTHALRLEFAGYRPFLASLEIPEGGLKKEVRLEKSEAGDEIRILEAGAKDSGPKESLARRATVLAGAANAQAVVVSALFQLEDRYILSAAWVDAAGQVTQAWTVTDLDFLQASVGAEAVAGALQKGKGPSFASAGVPAPKTAPDFNAWLLGFHTAPVLAATPATQATRAVEPDVPVVKRWWFWTIVGVAVVGAGAGVGAYFLTRPPNIVQQPDTVGVTLDVRQ